MRCRRQEFEICRYLDASVTAVVRSIDQLNRSRFCCAAAPFFDSISCRRRSCPRRRWLARRARTARNSPVSPARSFHFTIGRGASLAQRSGNKHSRSVSLCVCDCAPPVGCCQQWSKHAAGSGAEGSLGPSFSSSRPLPFQLFSGSSIVASIHSILPHPPF